MTDDARSFHAEDDAGDWLEEFEPAAEPVAEPVAEPAAYPAPPSELGHELIRIERAESAARLVIGGLAILVGLVIFGLGFSGLAAWGFDALGLDAEIQTSAAGIVIALIGLLVIGLARPKIRITPPADADEVRR